MTRPMLKLRFDRAEELSRALDEAVEQQHFARVRFHIATKAVADAQREYDAETEQTCG